MADYTNYEIRFDDVDVDAYGMVAEILIYRVIQNYIEKDFKDFLRKFYIHKQALEDLTVTVDKKYSDVLIYVKSKRDDWSFTYREDVRDVARYYTSLLHDLEKKYYAYYQVAYAQEMCEVNDELVRCFGRILLGGAKRVPNFCTYCGAVLNKETHNCDYCGALYE